MRLRLTGDSFDIFMAGVVFALLLLTAFLSGWREG